VRLRLAQDLSRREHAGVTESQLAAIRRSTCSGRPLGSQEFNSSREKEIRRRWRPKTRTVPLSYFIENSFQKWTRESADILGTAFVYVDYSIPVEDCASNSTPPRSRRLCGIRNSVAGGHHPHRTIRWRFPAWLAHAIRAKTLIPPSLKVRR
jgi:hypothetical protein